MKALLPLFMLLNQSISLSLVQVSKNNSEISNDLGEDVCTSKECYKTSYFLHSSMNTFIDPCEDFYEFACGRFIAETEIPSDQGEWSNFDNIGEDIYKQGRQLLEEDPAPDEFESYQKARDLYKSCIDEKTREELGVQPLVDKLREFGGWPVLDGEAWNQEETFRWWEWTYKMNNAGLGISSITSITLTADDRNSSYNVIAFDQAILGLARDYLLRGFEDETVQQYYTYMVNSAVLLGADLDFAKKDLKESLMFEIDLANITVPSEERRNATALYNPTTLGALPSLEGLPPSWTEYIQKLFEEADQIKVDESEKVVILNLEYFDKLSNLLKQTKPRVLANYLAWQAAKTVMSYLNKAAQKIDQDYDKVISGTLEPTPLWQSCVSAVGFNNLAGSFSLGFVAGSMYVRRFFNPEAKKSMLEMTSYIRKVFKEDIVEGLDWMDENTKARARKKLDQMDQFIAYSDEFLDKEIVDGLHRNITDVTPTGYLENTLHIIRFWRFFYYNRLRDKIDSKHWIKHGDVSLVNAFYSLEGNNIEFPAGILQGAFFNAKNPRYMNFGAIGAVIGHEITHGFDDRGKQRNGQGEIEDWWEPKTDESFKEKAQCFINQYGNFTVEQLGINLNGINTQGENIADNGGVKQAYKAYRRWVADNQEEARIVGLPYNTRQLFWISYAQPWCSKYRDETLYLHILIGAHSPSRYRVLGSLSNNEDFARDFNCPIGSKMNPEKKCVIW